MILHRTLKNKQPCVKCKYWRGKKDETFAKCGIRGKMALREAQKAGRSNINDWVRCSYSCEKWEQR